MRNNTIPRGGYIENEPVKYYVIGAHETADGPVGDADDMTTTTARNPFEALRNVLGGSILPEYVQRDTYRVGNDVYIVERGVSA